MERLFTSRLRFVRFAGSIVGEFQDAEDIVHNCFEKWLNLSDEKQERAKNKDAYFMQMVRNACLDFIKKNKPEYIEQEHLNNKAVLTIHPERQLIAKEDLNRLQQCMNQLPEKQRTVFYLREIEGYELYEIETVTQLSNEAIRTNLSRARKKMRTTYQNYLS